jgi:hypothetical protein
MQDHRSDAFLVVSQSLDARMHAYVPKLDHLVLTASDDLGLIGLTQNRKDGVVVSTQNPNLGLGADVPNSGC